MKVILYRDVDIAVLSVRLSVCRAPLLYRLGLTYRHTFFSTRHSSFRSTKHLCEIPMGSSPTGELNTDVFMLYINVAFFDQYMAVCGKRYNTAP